LRWLTGPSETRLACAKTRKTLKLYIKVLVFKEMSTLSYWELNYGFLVKDVLKALLGTLRLLNYDYAVLDSTKFTDWHKASHEAFLCVRVGEALFPVHADLTTSEAEFTEGTPPSSARWGLRR